MDGGLYAFPLGFGFQYVGINKNLPQSILDRFLSRSAISVYELMGMYLELIQEDEFSDLIFTSHSNFTFMVDSVFQYVLRDFIDISTRSVNLTDAGFISFLEKFRQIFYWANSALYTFPHTSPFWLVQATEYGFVTPVAHVWDVGLQYAFWVDGQIGMPAQTMLEPPDSPFLHFIPITDTMGNLRFSNHSELFTVTAQADGALAWEFMQHLIDTVVNPTKQLQYLQGGIAINTFGRYTLSTSIKREHFESQFTNNLFHIIDNGFMNTAGNAAEQVNRALARVSEFNEMPMVSASNFLPSELYNDILEQLLRGLITPEAAAQQLQNRIFLWLVE